ncbi:uncharacterized protein BDV14DRAFT_181059 [Aspergillus stella-maris]|uniref:uncharacterized protein n=1 Tax=Aspergillus stella-maris TaxID=1810926 RepID=UPI003CCE09BB
MMTLTWTSTSTSSSTRPVFNLVDHNNQQVTNTDLNGEYSLVFFGFTNCAVVCPRALSRLSEVLPGLGSAADSVNVFYITVDSERDTPDVMKRFLEKYPRYTGLTGTKDQIDAVRKEFHVFAKVKEDQEAKGGYVVPHTAITYLLDEHGAIVDHFNDEIEARAITAKVRKVIESGKQSNDVSNGVNDSSAVNEHQHESLKRLNKKQVASIRHIGNLARQLKGDWSNFMGPSHLNDGFGGYRYQLAFMFYALTLAHFHRLPAASGYFKDTMTRIITKMLEPDVWFYWHDASIGGGHSQTPAREMIYDPIVTDNIMYSGYVQVMTAMYNILFDDDRYTKPGALTFEYDAFFWGPAEGFKFVYDQNSLNERVYWNMVEEGYLGVACEPGCIFQICNQMPIHGFRLNDVLASTADKDEKKDRASEVTTGYIKAWTDFSGGILNDQGTFNTFYLKHAKTTINIPSAGGEAWAGLLMHAWNPQLVQETYDRRRDVILSTALDGTKAVNIPRAILGLPRNELHLNSGGIWGWVPAWATEMGDEDTKNALLSYADKYFHPKFREGGLMYPRNDQVFDSEGNFTMVSPILSNALLPLTRLNVRHGLKRFYEEPWGGSNRAHYSEPGLVDVDCEVDVYRAVFIPEEKKLVFDLAVADYEPGLKGSVTLGKIFGRGHWSLTRDGRELARGSSDALHKDKDGGVKQEGDLLRLPVTSTDIFSYVLQWEAQKGRCCSL